MFSPSLSYRQVSNHSQLKMPVFSKSNADSGRANGANVHFQGYQDKFHNEAAQAANSFWGTVCPQRELYNSVLEYVTEIENSDSWKTNTAPPVVEAPLGTEELKKHKHITYTKGEKRNILAEIRKLVLLPGIDTDQQALAEMKSMNSDRQLPNVSTLKVWRNQGIGR